MQARQDSWPQTRESFLRPPSSPLTACQFPRANLYALLLCLLVPYRLYV